MEEKKNVIDIDDWNIFNNPFQNFKPEENSVKLFEQFLGCHANHKILKRIADNEIKTKEREESGITRSEILRRMACRYGYRTKPTFVHRDILANYEGIIVNQMSCKGSNADSLYDRIRFRYPVIIQNCQKIPEKSREGTVVLSKVSECSNLWICSIFVQKYKGPIEWVFNLFGKATPAKPKDEMSFKKALVKMRIQIKKARLQDLPIYIPNEMGKSQGWDWNKNLPLIMKIFPDAVICSK